MNTETSTPQVQVTPQVLISPIKPLPKCACCSDQMLDEDEIHSSNDGDICTSCRDNEYFYCEYCNDIFHHDNLICINDNNYFCSSECAHSKGFYRCSDCDSWYHEDDSGYTNNNGDSICESCGENYTSCYQCGEVYHNVDTHYQRSTGESFCNDCWSHEDSLIKDYSYKPRDYVMSKMAYENTVYLGIELEIECAGNPSDTAEKVLAWLKKNKVNDKVYFKEDSSIDNGFEIVFMPYTLKAIHDKFPMKKFLRMLQDNGCTSHEKGTCGLHVHISKDGLGTSTAIRENNIYKGKLFFYKCQSYLKKLSARVSKNSSSDAFNFCKFENYMPEKGQNEYGHFSAFNINASSKTVEIRIFRGTLIYERFLASLQFCDAFGEYIQIISVSHLKNHSSSFIWTEFIKWVKGSGKYNQFYKYIIKKGII